MDIIHIKNLEVFANHGVFEEENRLGQKFIINADLYTDLSVPVALLKITLLISLFFLFIHHLICSSSTEVLPPHTIPSFSASSVFMLTSISSHLNS